MTDVYSPTVRRAVADGGGGADLAGPQTDTARGALCVICRALPRRLDRRGRPSVHCGRPECRGATFRGDHLQNAIGWPNVTGELDADFKRHNIDAGDGGVFRMNRPDARSYVGCAALRCVE